MSASAGRVLQIHKGDYDVSTTYAPMDEVLYQGSTYVCKTASTGNVPTNTTYWQLVASKGENTNAGAVTFDKTGTNLASTNVQGAIVEVDEKVDNVQEQAGGLQEQVNDVRMLGAKNLLPFPYYDNSKTINGVTFTVNDDGSVTANGTATAATHLNLLKDTTGMGFGENVYKGQIFTGLTSEGSASTFSLIADYSETGTSWKTGDQCFDLEGLVIRNYPYVQVHVHVSSGATVNNLIFKPMIRLASDPDDTYQPYAMTNKELTEQVKSINDKINHHIYGFRIDANEADPSARVTYLDDAVGMTPVHMDFSTNVFDYGSWENAFFMPRPCMLKSDGTRDYYLNPNNYTKREDGTASDVANTSYDGNAMMEWGRDGKKIWMKIVPIQSGKGAEVYIADYMVDSGYHDWPFHDENGKSAKHFYTAIYNGSVIDGKRRSLSGQQVANNTTAQSERETAQANNPSGKHVWDIECYADHMLIAMLMTLIGKSTDHQSVFGQGLNSGGSETINNAFRTGVHNTKGLFYGTNSGATATYTNAVKIFGTENLYGFQWHRYIGHIMVNGVQKNKLTYGTKDGSTVSGYNLTGDGYITPEGQAAPSGTNGGYVNKMLFSETGMIPQVASGSSSTYYCDGLWFNNGIVAVPLRGGASVTGAPVGGFCVDLGVAASYSSWAIGAALSCKKDDDDDDAEEG